MPSRRNFIKALSVAGIAGLCGSKNLSALNLFSVDDPKPMTNIKDALNFERKDISMPGLYPAKVVKIYNPSASDGDKINFEIVYQMIEESIQRLTGEKETESAWLKFVSKNDIIGLKLNPVAGKLLSTSHEVTKSVIEQLIKAGIPKHNIVIWDRREFELNEVGFDEKNYPGFKIKGTECKDTAGSFYDKENKLYSEERIDKEWYYYADVEESYDKETLPYMINEGKYSYFSKIVTKELDKIINIPILKNAGASVTLCLKNLAYGSISNTGRLHKKLWSETSAEVCAFPPIRDKVVVNIVDGIRGCYQGGPGADAKFITNFNMILAGTDAVAVDRIGYDIIFKKRQAENIQKEESPKGRKFLQLAEELKLGCADIDKIELINLG